jgi:catechol 2,3-dioxygenase-like lactoylglutathione lyase family enzyme
MQIKGLDHVQIAMPPGGEDAARQFYGALLGMTEIPKPAQLAGRGGCWFQAPGIQLHMGVERDFIPARKAHPALLVADLGALQERLAAAGVATTPDDTVPGVRRCYAADPFGNRIEFIQDGDGFSQQSFTN